MTLYFTDDVVCLGKIKLNKVSGELNNILAVHTNGFVDPVWSKKPKSLF